MTTHVLWVIVHSLAVVVFVNRYVAGIILRLARGKQWDETRDDYEPTITAVVPMFNEGAAIKETLHNPQLIAEGERTERIIEYLDPESTLKNAQTIVTNVTPEQKKRVQTILARNK